MNRIQSSSRRCWLIAALALAWSGCAPERIPPPEQPPPAVARPSDGIPGDLDVAVRVDLASARRLIGPAISKALEIHTADPDDGPGRRLLDDAIAGADTIWIALRPGLEAHLTDNVIIARGDFAELRPRAYEGGARWGAPTDLGADWRRHDRTAPARRSAPARLYARSSDLLVVVSEAEIDSTERSVEMRAGDDHVDPPETGTVSMAARVRPLLHLIELRFPSVVALLEQASLATLSVAIETSGLTATAEVRFVDADDAKRAADAMERLLERLGHVEGIVGRAARATKASAVAELLVVETALGPDGLAEVIRCVAGDPACDAGS